MSDIDDVTAAADRLATRLHATPPPHNINPDDVDEDLHPTSAWTVGEMLDQDTIDRLERIARGDD